MQGTDNKPKTNLKKPFKFMHEVVSALGSHYAEMALKLFLSLARLADAVGQEAIAYEFLSQSFTLYEDMATAKVQVRSLTLAAGVLYECTHFNQENCGNLVTSVAKYAAKLLKKPDQCRMVQICCPLFFALDEAHQKPFSDDQKCLVRMRAIVRRVRRVRACMRAGARVGGALARRVLLLRVSEASRSDC